MILQKVSSSFKNQDVNISYPHLGVKESSLKVVKVNENPFSQKILKKRPNQYFYKKDTEESIQKKDSIKEEDEELKLREGQHKMESKEKKIIESQGKNETRENRLIKNKRRIEYEEKKRNENCSKSLSLEEKLAFMDTLKITDFDRSFFQGNPNRKNTKYIIFSKDKNFSFVCKIYAGIFK